jgi:hypothetical protein
MPTGFTLSDVNVYKLTSGSEDKIPVYVGTYDAGTKTIKGYSKVQGETLEVEYDSNNAIFKISGFNLDNKEKYVVEFTGTQVLLGKSFNGEPLTEIKNKSQVTYYEKSNGTTNSGTTNTGTTSNIANNDNSKANSVSRIERLSNEVETDVVHLYYQINKTIDSATADPSQSFLFKVSYFKNEADYLAAIGANGTANSSEAGTSSETDNNSDHTASDNVDFINLEEPDGNDDEKASADSTSASATTEAKAESVSYVRISCTTPVTKRAEDGTLTTIGYTGSQLVQCDRRGIYLIEEVTGLSATDYDLESVTAQTYDLTKIYNNTGTSSSGTTETSSGSGTAVNSETSSGTDTAVNSETSSGSGTAVNSETVDNTATEAAETQAASESEVTSSTVLYMHINSTDDYVTKNYVGTGKDAKTLPADFKYIPAVYTYDEKNLSDLTYHIVGFTNKPSKYAYLSSQAYISNNFNFK